MYDALNECGSESEISQNQLTLLNPAIRNSHSPNGVLSNYLTTDTFEHSAPCGPLHLATDVGHLTEGNIALTVNGELRQEGNLNQMIWKIPDMIVYLSTYYELAPGDVILSGTPSGVGAVQKGDVMRISLEPLGHLEVSVT